MARKTKAIATLSSVRLDPLPEDPILTSARARVLTARFSEVKASWFRDTVDAVIELGHILAEGRQHFGPKYKVWLAEVLHVETATAANYVRLAELADRSPSSIARFKELGLAKLYKVARLPPVAREAVLHTPDVARLTDGEFHTLTAQYLQPTRKVTGNMKAHGLRQKVRAATQTMLVPPPRRIEDPAIRKALRKDLIELARAARAMAEQLK